jgi:signal peptidase II
LNEFGEESGSSAGLPRGNILYGVIAVAVLVTLDQAAKLAVVSWLGPDSRNHRWELAGKYLAFQYVENRGAAFGILEGRAGLLVVLALAVGAGFIVVIRRELAENPWIQWSLVLIVAGAIGNLTDRIRLGYVVDYISIGVWPKFNIADSCITIGVLLLIYTSLFPPPAATSDTKDQPID